VSAKRQSMTRSWFDVVLVRDSSELGRCRVMAYDEENAVEEARDDLTRTLGIDLYDGTLNFHVEKIQR
jgi:hypothetical protein